jgi:hypothetical protein
VSEPDAGALAVLAAAGQRNAGVYLTEDGVQDLQAAQLAAQPDEGEE